MLSDAFSLGGLAMFILGVFLATWVKSAVGGLKGKVAP
jgi:hypothetical protein